MDVLKYEYIIGNKSGVHVIIENVVGKNTYTIRLCVAKNKDSLWLHDITLSEFEEIINLLNQTVSELKIIDIPNVNNNK